MPHFVVVSRRLLLVLLIVFAAGCARRMAPVPLVPASRTGGEVEDLRVLPQDLNAYLRPGTADRRLIPYSLAALRMESFRRTWLAPWMQTRPEYSRRQIEKIFIRYTKSPGFGTGGRRNSPGFASGLQAAAGLRSYPNVLRRAVTVKNTSLRGMPTTLPRFSDPSLPGEGYPFDYLQHTALPPGTPIFVTQASRDGRWYLAEAALTFGWLPARDVAFVGEQDVSRLMTAKLAAIIRERVPLPGTGITASVGAIFPLRHIGSQGLAVLVPQRAGGGQVRFVQASLPTDAAVAMPMPMTPRNVAAVGNQFMGQRYGWGGLDGLRDCSALTHDLFVPFGIYLPRNSAIQATAGGSIALGNMSNGQKESVIVSQGVPFGTLIWIRGHILVYVGEYRGHPVVFHDMWGLRTFGAGGRDGRLVIGRAVVTTLRAGQEVPAVGPQHILLNRVRSMVFLTRPTY